MSRQAKYWYGFGPFCLDPTEHLLLREGHPVPLPPKAFATLLMLVQQSGHVLGKDELMRAIWPETFVEENNLTQCVSTLRKALGEGQDEHQYIETVPRLGYRFVAEVRVVEGEDPGVVLARRTRAHIVIREEKEEQETTAPDQAGTAPSFDAEKSPPSQSLHAAATELRMSPAWPATTTGRTVAAQLPLATAAQAKRWKVFVPAAVVAALLAAATLIYFRRAQPLTERDSILLADFVNTTGEPVFDGTLKQALAVKLEESPFLNVVPEQRVRETLRFMGRSPDERLAAPLAQEVCERRGVKAMLTGSIASLGSHYVIALEAVNCATGDSLAREQIEAESREQVLRAVGKATSKLRGKLGESLSSIRKFDTPIEEATTPSLEALKAYSLGEALRAKGVQGDAIPFFERAIELDPNFALAFGRLGSVYVNVGEPGRAIQYKKKAFELRERVSEREKFYISAAYYHTVTGEISKTVTAYEVWKKSYPRDWEPFNNLAAQYNSAGQFDRALEEGREAMRLNPNTVFPYATSGWAALGLNRYEEAKGIFEQAHAHKLDSPYIHRGLYAVAFVRGDAAAMQRQTEWARGTPDEFRMLNFQAQAEAFSGKLQRARETYRRSVALAQRGKFKDNAASIAAGGALLEANFGNYRQAREKALAALAIARGPDALGIAAATLALSSEVRQAQALSEELAEGYPTDTLVNAVAVSSARAAIELHKGDPAKALELLQSAIPYEFGPFVFGQGYLPIYLRGRACLRAGKGTEAAAEFQKILDHRGAAPFSPLYVLAHLGLARAYILSGDLPKGRPAYEDFLALWKDADVDIPILQEAKAEYARLE